MSGHVAPHPHAHIIERTVVRKILFHLLPFLAIQYVFCLLDRTNVSIAALQMQGDLGFNDAVYGLGAGIFFLGYFLFEIPSNLIMEKVGARLWIARIMVTWGIISACMMFVRTPLSFYSLRFLLGLAEAGFYPGIILYLTYWIPSHLRASVIARFLAMTGVLQIFGPIVGAGLLKMHGLLGLPGWQWLFLLEGLPSVVLGFFVLKYMPNGPRNVHWLTDDEKDWVCDTVARDSASDHKVQHLSFKIALTDKRIVGLVLIFIVTSTGGNAVGFFGPALIKARSGGTWPDWVAAIVSAIPTVVGAIAMAIAATHSDRSGRRRSHVALGYGLAGLAFLALVWAPNAPLTLLALSINTLGERVAAGSYWAVTTNVLGARAAAGGIAFINSVGNLGGFIGPFLMGWLKKSTGGGYFAGLLTAALLFLLGSAFSYLFLVQHAAHKPEPPNDTAIDPDGGDTKPKTPESLTV
jgi:ACS family tartrate transporter-like MFS transporter